MVINGLKEKGSNSYNYRCPHCDTANILLEGENISTRKVVHKLTQSNKKGYKEFHAISQIIVCGECQELIFGIALETGPYFPGSFEIGSWDLIPQSSFRHYSDAIVPSVILNDYQEACSIIQLSPKASATLFRRCLQGMIRDFWGISKSRLVDEINALKEVIDPAVFEAIDALRNIGNIGAHFAADINHIIEIDEGEAEQLKGLIELLIEEWYINRFNRNERLQKVQELGIQKKNEQKSFKN